MKICVLMQEIQTLGGLQRVVTTLLNELVKNPAYEVCIISPITEDCEQLYPVSEKIKLYNSRGLREISFPFRVLRKINKMTAFFQKKQFTDFIDEQYFPKQMIEKYGEILEEEKADCVVGAGAYYAILASKVAKQLHIPCVAWLHSTFEGYFNMPEHDTYGMLLLFEKYASFMNELLVLTDKDREVFMERVRTLKSNPVVFYNPLTIPVVEKSVSGNKQLLFVGRLNMEVKGIDLLVPIMKRVCSVFPDVKLNIVGDGADKDKLLALIGQEHLEKNIVLRGQTNQVQKYYEQSSILLVTSRYEGFGLVITEAMAHGIPVVAFHAYGPDEIIQDSVNGYLFEQGDVDGYADGVIRILNDKETWKQLSEEAVRRADDFRLDVILEEFIRILERVVYGTE